MKRPFALLILPVTMMGLSAGACSTLDPMAEQSSTPAWIQERLEGDVAGREAPPVIPTGGYSTADGAELDRETARVIARRDAQNALIAELNAEGQRDADAFVETGRERTERPQ
jgi:hypothetical protein